MALEFFLNNTYRDVSINDIVKEVGITKGGFYHYFRSKEELFSQVVEDFIVRYTQMFLAFFNNDIDLKQKLDFIAKKMVEIYKSEEVKKISLNYDIFWNELKKHNNRLFDKAISMGRKCLEAVKGMFEEEKRKGILRNDLDCEGTAIMFIASLKGVALYSIYIEEERLEKNINTLIENFWRGIQATE